MERLWMVREAGEMEIFDNTIIVDILYVNFHFETKSFPYILPPHRWHLRWAGKFYEHGIVFNLIKFQAVVKIQKKNCSPKKLKTFSNPRVCMREIGVIKFCAAWGGVGVSRQIYRKTIISKLRIVSDNDSSGKKGEIYIM